VKCHGNDAAVIAAQHADEYLGRSDVDGQMIWKGILAAVRELQRKPAAGERRN
jgi:hypothetical protein